MARSYNTIPALDDDALAPKQTKSWKGLVAGAALASFVRGNFNDVPGPAQPYVEWVPFDEQNVGELVLNNCPMVKTDSARWQAAHHYGAPAPSYITQDCTSVEWKHDGTKTQGWYCGDKQDPGNPVFSHVDGYTHKGKKLSYANSCIHFNCEAGAGYNKDMEMWQCLDDLNQDSG